MPLSASDLEQVSWDLGAPPSRQEAAVAELHERLAQAAGGDGPRVHRHRTRVIWEDELAGPGAIVLYTMGEDGEEADHSLGRDNEVSLRAELRVKTLAGGTPPDVLLDRIYVFLARVLAIDPTLGGLAEDITITSRTWDAIEGQAVFGAMAVDLSMTLFARLDPTEGP